MFKNFRIVYLSFFLFYLLLFSCKKEVTVNFSGQITNELNNNAESNITLYLLGKFSEGRERIYKIFKSDINGNYNISYTNEKNNNNLSFRVVGIKNGIKSISKENNYFVSYKEAYDVPHVMNLFIPTTIILKLRLLKTNSDINISGIKILDYQTRYTEDFFDKNNGESIQLEFEKTVNNIIDTTIILSIPGINHTKSINYSLINSDNSLGFDQNFSLSGATSNISGDTLFFLFKY